MRDDAPPIRLKLGTAAAAPVRDEAVDSWRERSSNDSHRVDVDYRALIRVIHVKGHRARAEKVQ